MKIDQKTMKAMRGMDKSGMKKMKAGGPTSLDRKNMGRNMSRVNNQRSR
jgi:hypothetical protein